VPDDAVSASRALALPVLTNVLGRLLGILRKPWQS